MNKNYLDHNFISYIYNKDLHSRWKYYTCTRCKMQFAESNYEYRDYILIVKNGLSSWYLISPSNVMLTCAEMQIKNILE